MRSGNSIVGESGAQAEAAQFSIERGTVVVEYLRRLLDIAAGAFERLRDRFALDVVLG